MASPSAPKERTSTASGGGADGARDQTAWVPLEVAGVSRSFKGKVALHPLDLTVEGGVVALLGPNGSGKSTLMRILVGLVRPDTGTATVAGVRLSGDGTEVRRHVTYMPGELHLYGEMRAADHLDWLLRGRTPEARARAREHAESLELPLRRRVRAYSHGMKRQLCFAAAMAPDVRLRILDEPTDGLDPSRRSQFLDLLAEDAARGVTILLSSHHFGEVDRVCERLVFMNEGRKVADETAAAVAEQAAKTIHLTWPEGARMDEIVARCCSDGVRLLHRDGNKLALLLPDADPRDFLARLAAAKGDPAPVSLSHGQISLQEFYRSLYGTEGC